MKVYVLLVLMMTFAGKANARISEESVDDYVKRIMRHAQQVCEQHVQVNE